MWIAAYIVKAYGTGLGGGFGGQPGSYHDISASSVHVAVHVSQSSAECFGEQPARFANRRPHPAPQAAIAMEASMPTGIYEYFCHMCPILA